MKAKKRPRQAGVGREDLLRSVSAWEGVVLAAARKVFAGQSDDEVRDSAARYSKINQPLDQVLAAAALYELALRRAFAGLPRLRIVSADDPSWFSWPRPKRRIVRGGWTDKGIGRKR